MHPCHFDACINGTSQNFGLKSFSHHQTHNKNVLISDVYTHLRKLRNETSAWRHIVGITQISVSQKLAINVIGPSGPLNLIHEAQLTFRSAELSFH